MKLKYNYVALDMANGFTYVGGVSELYYLPDVYNLFVKDFSLEDWLMGLTQEIVDAVIDKKADHPGTKRSYEEEVARFYLSHLNAEPSEISKNWLPVNGKNIQVVHDITSHLQML